MEKIEHDITKNNFKYWGDNSIEGKVSEILEEMPEYIDFQKKKINIQKDMAKVAPELRQFYSEPLLNKKQEFHIFRKMNYYKYKTKLFFDTFKTNKIKEYEVKCVESYNEYISIRNFIVSCNTRLAAQILKKRKDFYGDNLNDLISDCFLNIIKAADAFDYTRGFKFSTYCTWVLMNNSLRDHSNDKKFYDNISTNMDYSTFSEKLDEKQFQHLEKQELNESISSDIKSALELIKQKDPREHFVLVNCFGIGLDKKKTLKEISIELNLTKERVRQIRENGIKYLQQKTIDGDLKLNSVI
jgi:RNA polymerase sigma factor (sigma-70 family)